MMVTVQYNINIVVNNTKYHFLVLHSNSGPCHTTLQCNIIVNNTTCFSLRNIIAVPWPCSIIDGCFSVLLQFLTRPFPGLLWSIKLSFAGTEIIRSSILQFQEIEERLQVLEDVC